MIEKHTYIWESHMGFRLPPETKIEVGKKE